MMARVGDLTHHERGEEDQRGERAAVTQESVQETHVAHESAPGAPAGSRTDPGPRPPPPDAKDPDERGARRGPRETVLEVEDYFICMNRVVSVLPGTLMRTKYRPGESAFWVVSCAV